MAYNIEVKEMNIGVAYADMHQQIWLKLEVPEGSNALQAIELSGILKRIEIEDVTKHKIGIYGKTIKPTQVLQEGDRVEIYRPIIADPKKVPRRDLEDDDDEDDD